MLRFNINYFFFFIWYLFVLIFYFVIGIVLFQLFLLYICGSYQKLKMNPFIFEIIQHFFQKFGEVLSAFIYFENLILMRNQQAISDFPPDVKISIDNGAGGHFRYSPNNFIRINFLCIFFIYYSFNYSTIKNIFINFGNSSFFKFM